MITTKQELEDCIFEFLNDKLSLQFSTTSDFTHRIQLTLGGQPIGKTHIISLNWATDRGHGGGSFIDGLIIKKI